MKGEDMTNVDFKLSDNIATILSRGVLERAKDFYNLAFFLTLDSEEAVRNIKDCVSAGLFNARKIQIIPPVKTWFYQELIVLCLKRGRATKSSMPFAYKNEYFRRLIYLDAQTRAIFALYYFEENFGMERVAKVMRMKIPKVRKKLAYACEEIGITGKNDAEDEKIFEEITRAYHSPGMPQEYKNGLREVIEREKELNAKYFTKDRRSKRLRIIFGVVIIAMIAYLIYTGGINNVFR